MSARAVVAPVLLTLVVLFAGCTGPGGDDVAPPVDEPVVHTRPGDDGGISDAEARNRSHLHDYWSGAPELIIMDATYPVSCFLCGSGAVFRFEPDAGAVVPQGARWVNITIGWSTGPDDFYESPSLWIETAADHAPWAHGPVASGDTISIEVNNTQNDLPHELLSNWAIELHPGVTETGGYRFVGEVSILMVAARGHEIPVYPPHPDRWDNQTEILLFDQEDDANGLYMGSPETGNTGLNWLGPHVPDEGRVVPYDAAYVEVVITYDDDAPVPFTLGFHGAETREWTLLEPVTVDGNVRTYHIPPEVGLPDGPYVQQSHWVFEAFTDDDETPVFTGGYGIRATAYRHAA